MKKLIAPIIAITALIATGCSTTDKDAPKHMSRVQCVEYDSTKRPAKTSIEVFDQPPARKYKVIALITCEGAYHEEVVMNKAILYKAKQLGADAIIQLGTSSATTGSGSMYGGHHGTRSIFRANAIVFE
jgi:hypothetical protein